MGLNDYKYVHRFGEDLFAHPLFDQKYSFNSNTMKFIIL